MKQSQGSDIFEIVSQWTPYNFSIDHCCCVIFLTCEALDPPVPVMHCVQGKGAGNSVFFFRGDEELRQVSQLFSLDYGGRSTESSSSLLEYWSYNHTRARCSFVSCISSWLFVSYISVQLFLNLKGQSSGLNVQSSWQFWNRSKNSCC